jgi:hypothetical protein
MHNGAVYSVNPDDFTNNSHAQDTTRALLMEQPNEEPVLEVDRLPASARIEFENLVRRWELWRQQQEARWTDKLRAKETARMQELAAEAALKDEQRAVQLMKAQTEYEKLERHLRRAIEEAEMRQREAKALEESLKLKHAQKLVELQLLQRRIREEANAKVDVENRKTAALERQLASLQDALLAAERKVKDYENEFEMFKQSTRRTPEHKLREEVARWRGEIAERDARIERERAERHAVTLEKEHFRSLVNRLAMALKRERERSNILERQEMEQLRLEYLAREERYGGRMRASLRFA